MWVQEIIPTEDSEGFLKTKNFKDESEKEEETQQLGKIKNTELWEREIWGKGENQDRVKGKDRVKVKNHFYFSSYITNNSIN